MRTSSSICSVAWTPRPASSVDADCGVDPNAAPVLTASRDPRGHDRRRRRGRSSPRARRTPTATRSRTRGTSATAARVDRAEPVAHLQHAGHLHGQGDGQRRQGRHRQSRRSRRRRAAQGRRRPGGSAPTSPLVLALTLGGPAQFGALTPGVARRVHGLRGRHRHEHRGRRGADGHRPGHHEPGQAGQRHLRAGRSRSRSGRPTAANPSTAFAPVAGAASPLTLLTWPARDQLGRGDGRVQAGRRCRRDAARRQLRQDADVHAVDHDTVT